MLKKTALFSRDGFPKGRKYLGVRLKRSEIGYLYLEQADQYTLYTEETAKYWGVIPMFKNYVVNFV